MGVRAVKEWADVVKLEHAKITGLAWGRDATMLASVGLDKALKIWA